MPDIVGRLRTPRLSLAPASPVVGEVYFDTVTNKLKWWNGTAWVPADATAGLAIANPMCVHKFGNPSGGVSSAFTTTWEIYGTTVGDLGQSMTATQNIWWEVDFWCLAATATAAYNRCDGQVWYDQGYPTDELGKTKGQFFSIYNHSAIGLQTIRMTALLKCLAGRTYGVRGVLTAATGGTWTTHHHVDHVGSISKVVGYW